jgi:hypothetical protein
MMQMVIELVLGTDMKQHFSMISHFTATHRLVPASSTPTGLTSLEQGSTSRWVWRHATNETLYQNPNPRPAPVIIPLEQARTSRWVWQPMKPYARTQTLGQNH